MCVSRVSDFGVVRRAGWVGGVLVRRRSRPGERPRLEATHGNVGAPVLAQIRELLGLVLDVPG
jgi:hypothetical protein